MTEKKLLRISEIAKKAGVMPSTIRYYTDLGLLRTSDFTEGGHRLYSEEVVLPLVKQIRFLEHNGLSIEDIKQQLLVTRDQKKILVIDDEQEICDLIVELLKEKFPHEIRIANDGFSAGRIMNEFLPNLVILDLLLPGVNGFDICKQIKSDQYLKDTKILAITGYDTPEHREKIFAAGTDDYLTKPMELKSLYAKICRLLNIEQK